MLIKLAMALVVIALVLGGVIAMQPSEFRVERTATVAAPAPAVFTQVNDFHNWEAWSPWAKLDPSVKNSFEGAPAGTGASFAWAGNSKVGEGRMTIVESRPSELVRIKLEFLKPFAATNTAEFTFTPEGDRTTVTWSMYGRNNFAARAIGVVVNMDTFLGGEFEKGLGSMKTVAETSAKK